MANFIFNGNLGAKRKNVIGKKATINSMRYDDEKIEDIVRELKKLKKDVAGLTKSYGDLDTFNSRFSSTIKKVERLKRNSKKPVVNSAPFGIVGNNIVSGCVVNSTFDTSETDTSGSDTSGSDTSSEECQGSVNIVGSSFNGCLAIGTDNVKQSNTKSKISRKSNSNKSDNDIEHVVTSQTVKSKKRKRQPKKKYKIKCDGCGDEFSSDNEDVCLCDKCENFN